MTDTISLVKNYSRYKWECFPLPPKNKVPVVKWADVATSDENMLVGWFDTNPNANIGITCGKRSGITVIDIDAKNGGYESLAALIEQHGKLPTTPIAKTGGGGEHCFFKYAEGTRNSAGRIGPGIDVRSDGGYVVGPGSIHPNGQPYEWVISPDSVPLAPLPEWMAEILKDTPPQSIPVATNGKIANGARNDTLTKMAGSMRRKGFDEDSIYQALLVENQKKCLPPISDGEVYVIARSIARYTPSDPIEAVEEAQPSSALEVIDSLEADIIERQKNPTDVWGIHYAWPFLSLATGGKQKGELIYLGGEPKIGKSWWAHQDAMWTAIGQPSKNISATPTLIWSGEMKAKQVFRRMIEMMGVPKRRMLTGNMTPEYWQKFNEAKAILANSPLHVSDVPLDLKGAEEFLKFYIGEFGVEYALFDYDWHISATGQNEIETSQNISRAFKQLAHKLNISIMLISSVNKAGMDAPSGAAMKSNLSGSGKKLHDADVIYILTKLNEGHVPIETMNFVQPTDYWRVVTLHIAAARDMDYHLPEGAVNYMRQTPNPSFQELKDMTKKETVPSWIDRADIGD